MIATDRELLALIAASPYGIPSSYCNKMARRNLLRLGYVTAERVMWKKGEETEFLRTVLFVTALGRVMLQEK